MLLSRPGRAATGSSALTVIALLALLAPASAVAQGQVVRFDTDSASARTAAEATSAHLLHGAEVDGLPVDSVEGALLLLPGITAGAGTLSFRGAAGGDHATYLNGVDVTRGNRRVRLGAGTNALAAATAVTGPLPAALGNTRAGALLLETRAPAFGRFARASYETDGLLGPSLGLNRFEASLGGATRSARVFIAGTLTGLKGAEFGADARDVPIFVPAGLDTTVAVPSLPGDAASDTSFVDVSTFAVSRGDCERFAPSANAGIADNYGRSCTGDRTPGSARSGYRLLATAEYDAGRASKLTLLALRARESARRFAYADLYNRSNLFARQDESRVYGITLGGPLGERRSDGAYRVGLSRQSDQLTVGPLTPAGEAKTYDPAGGLMLGGLDFRWDLESFPVDSALIANYRANIPGTRRSPYTLENTSQYTTIDQYRDGPYAAYEFPERGGPIGPLTLFREDRSVAFANGTWSVSANALFTLGGEYVRYSLASYDHQLISQAFSNVYRATPARGAVFAEDRLAYGPVTFIGGVRYEFFSSRAERPQVLDTMATVPGGAANPFFGTYRPFPRIASYTDADSIFRFGGAELPLVTFLKDRRHASWSPRFRALFDVAESTQVRAGVARQARMPDLGLLFAGVNTDLAITNLAQIFGTDLGYERSWVTELGLRQAFGSSTALDLAGYRRTGSDLVVARLRPAPDPTRANTSTDLREWTNAGRETATGLEMLLAHSAGPLSARLSYGFQRVRIADSVRSGTERPHTLSATLGYAAPADRRSGILRGTTAWVALRWTSGASYAPCAIGDPSLSDEICLNGSFLAPARLPAFRQLDFRFTRRLGAASSAPILYLDARNLLNLRNTIRVFSATGTTDNAAARAGHLDATVFDYAAEADANGLLQANGDLDLTFAGAGAGGCAGWVAPNGNGAEPNCMALVRAEQRFGNGDGVFSVTEQTETANARFDALRAHGFYAEPRRIRAGLEIGF